jgi:hypothetical protein
MRGGSSRVCFFPKLHVRGARGRSVDMSRMAMLYMYNDTRCLVSSKLLHPLQHRVFGWV